ncbi:hypothetical protein ACOME3_002937 [Neoechinorhynchus agilis]
MRVPNQSKIDQPNSTTTITTTAIDPTPLGFWSMAPNLNHPMAFPLPESQLSRFLSPYQHSQWIDYQMSLPYQGYMACPALELNVSRRKNATRENTAILKKWLNENMSNPYPTKTQKSHLASLTGMSLVQVATWFANARRRLKKENKMTWEPKSRYDEATSADGNDSECGVSDDQKTVEEKVPKSQAYFPNELQIQTSSMFLKRPAPSMFEPIRKRVKFSSVEELAKSDCIDNQPFPSNPYEFSLNIPFLFASYFNTELQSMDIATKKVEQKSCQDN